MTTTTRDHGATARPDLTLVHSAEVPATGDRAFTVLLAVSAPHDVITLASIAQGLDDLGTFRQIVVHTGSPTHGLRLADVVPRTRLDVEERWLHVTPGAPASHVAAVLAAFAPLLTSERPGLLLVAGDGPATLACALAAATAGVPVARAGAGLRSWDWSAPDEIHRVLIDRIADTLLTSAADAVTNLESEGVPTGRIHHVGNTLVDVVRRCEARALKRASWRAAGLREHDYLVLALHRPSALVARTPALYDALIALAERVPVVMLPPDLSWEAPQDDAAAAALAHDGVPLVVPSDHLDALSLLMGSGGVVTDDGAVQESCSAIGIDCFTLGTLTERTVTLAYGSNRLLGDSPDALARLAPSQGPGTPCAIRLWDGQAGKRAAEAIVANYVLQGEALA